MTPETFFPIAAALLPDEGESTQREFADYLSDAAGDWMREVVPHLAAPPEPHDARLDRVRQIQDARRHEVLAAERSFLQAAE